jgi:hypothetical protein
VTVCIGAIAERNTLIGVADRMMTAGNGDIEFEPEQGKFWVFTPSIVALMAGDASIQSELYKQVQKEVQTWILKDPDTWVNVKDIASLYCQKFREFRRQRAEAEILSPLGLDTQSFLANQTTMERELVNRIADKLLEYEFPELLETIFMGIDNDGALGNEGQKLTYTQLYVTYYDRLMWFSTVGFAAIGIGKAHAESQFTFSGHSPLKPFDDTLLLAYAAKKRAEAAPGVGKNTDLLVVGPALGMIFKFDDSRLAELESIYQKNRRSSLKAVVTAQKQTKKFVERVRAENEQKAKQKLGSDAKTP